MTKSVTWLPHKLHNSVPTSRRKRRRRTADGNDRRTARTRLQVDHGKAVESRRFPACRPTCRAEELEPQLHPLAGAR